MKVIELLNKIAKGEELPKTIVWNYKHYQIGVEQYYETEGRMGLFEKIFNILNDRDALNEEVEIIKEEKTIEIHNLKELEEHAYMDEYNEHEVEENRYAINALIRAVKQLDKKISEVK